MPIQQSELGKTSGTKPEKTRIYNQILPAKRLKPLYIATANKRGLEIHEIGDQLFICANSDEITAFNEVVQASIQEFIRQLAPQQHSSQHESAILNEEPSQPNTAEPTEQRLNGLIRVLLHSVWRTLLSFFSGQLADLPDPRS